MFGHQVWIAVMLFAIWNTKFSSSSECTESGKSLSYLDVAMDMITKAKTYFPTCPSVILSNSSKNFLDCSDVLKAGFNKSGMYKVWPSSRILNGQSLDVYCDMDTDGGGWTVIQRRGNYSRPNDYFFKDWVSYKNGFGDPNKDFWIGNDNIFALTNQRLYSIRFDLKDTEQERRYALYDSFWVDDEYNKYRIHITDYSGSAGDSMGNHNGQKFTTKDQDNDSQKDQNCALQYKGGWWYNACHLSNLNGLDLRGKHESFADGIEWHSWKGYKDSLDTTEMKIRPKDFKKKSVINEFETPR